MSVFDPDWKPEPGEPIDMFPTLVMVGAGFTIVPVALRWVGNVIVDVINKDPGSNLASIRLATRKVREAQARLLSSTKRRDDENTITFYSRVTIEALGLVAQAPEIGLETLGLQLHNLATCLFPGLGNSTAQLHARLTETFLELDDVAEDDNATFPHIDRAMDHLEAALLLLDNGPPGNGAQVLVPMGQNKNPLNDHQGPTGGAPPQSGSAPTDTDFVQNLDVIHKKQRLQDRIAESLKAWGPPVVQSQESIPTLTGGPWDTPDGGSGPDPPTHEPLLDAAGMLYHSTPKPPDQDLSDDELEDTLELSEPDGAAGLVEAAARPMETNATADSDSSLDPQVQPVLEDTPVLAAAGKPAKKSGRFLAQQEEILKEIEDLAGAGPELPDDDDSHCGFPL